MDKLETILTLGFPIVGTLHFISTGIGLSDIYKDSACGLSYNLTLKVILPFVCGAISYGLAYFQIRRNLE